MGYVVSYLQFKELLIYLQFLQIIEFIITFLVPNLDGRDWCVQGGMAVDANLECFK